MNLLRQIPSMGPIRAALFAAVNIPSGKVLSGCQQRNCAKEFAKFLHQLEKEVPLDQKVHLVMHNYSTHKSKLVQ